MPRPEVLSAEATFSLVEAEDALCAVDESPPATRDQVYHLYQLIVDLREKMERERATLERLIQILGS